MNIQEAVSAFLLSSAGVRSPRTNQTYKYGLRRFLNYLQTRQIQAEADLKSLTPDDFIYFQGWLGTGPFKKGTRTVYIAAVHTFVEWLVIQNQIAFSYAESLRYQQSIKVMSRKREASLPKLPQAEDVSAILKTVYASNAKSSLKERNIALIEFLISTGCRASEAAQVLIRDIDLKNGRAKVMGKGSKERIVFLSPSAVAALRTYWAKRGYQDGKYPAFMGHKKTGAVQYKTPIKAKTVWEVVKHMARLASIEQKRFSPHYFRHAFATRMLTETNNLAIVQDLLGHASPQSTRVYAKITAQQLQEAHRKVYGV